MEHLYPSGFTYTSCLSIHSFKTRRRTNIIHVRIDFRSNGEKHKREILECNESIFQIKVFQLQVAGFRMVVCTVSIPRLSLVRPRGHVLWVFCVERGGWREDRGKLIVESWGGMK